MGQARTWINTGRTAVRAVTQTTTFQLAKERLRKGVTRIANSQRVPRLVAGTAELLATLLTSDHPPTHAPKPKVGSDGIQRHLDLKPQAAEEPSIQPAQPEESKTETTPSESADSASNEPAPPPCGTSPTVTLR